MLTLNQEVLVDGVPGIVAGIYPNGKIPYIGKLHAYIWVKTPSLDYEELSLSGYHYTQSGRSVLFSEISKRIVEGEKQCSQ